MIDAIQEIDEFEPQLGLAPPTPFAPASMLLWAGMFAAVYMAASSLIAMMYARR